MLQQIAPYFGYLASLCLIMALLVKTELNFRWFSLAGNVFFIIYSLILWAIPVFITNGILLVINLYYLRKLFKKEEYFDLIEFQGEEKMVDKFLLYYNKDISGYFPSFTKEQLQGGLNFAVLRDLVIANIFSARLMPNGDAEVNINYTLEKYRDFKVGNFIFQKEKNFLLSKGVKRIIYRNVASKKHLEFLNVMGFKAQDNNGNYCMVKEL
ncbi:MAG: hypothetical protein WAT19_08305 [Ferruginibacter sp.]